MIRNFDILHFLLLIVSYGVSNTSGDKNIIIDSVGTEFNTRICEPYTDFNIDNEYAALEEGVRVTPTQEEVIIIIDHIGGYRTLALALSDKSTFIPKAANLFIDYSSVGFYDHVGDSAYYTFPDTYRRDNILLRLFTVVNALDNAKKVKIILTCWQEDCLRDLLRNGNYYIPNISKNARSVALFLKKNPGRNIQTIHHELEALSEDTDPEVSSLAKALLGSEAIVPLELMNDKFDDASIDIIRKQVKKLPSSLRQNLNITFPMGRPQRTAVTCLGLRKVGMELVTTLRNHYILHEKEHLNSSSNVNKTISENIYEFIEKLREDTAYLEPSYKRVLDDFKPPSDQLYGKLRAIVEHLIDPDSKKESPFLPKGERLVKSISEMEHFMKFVPPPWLRELTTFIEEDLVKLRNWYENLRELMSMDLSINSDQDKHQNLEDLLNVVENTHPIPENALLAAELVKNVIFVASKRKVTKLCSEVNDEVKMMVRGDMIRMSYVNNHMCEGNLKFIEIFASDTVIIDEDLNLIGQEVQVQIVATVWDIVGNRSINLNGEDGKEWEDTKAEDSNSEGSKLGGNGKPGLPGGPAGNFYGIAKTIFNAKNLVVTANGGDGGPGQDGGDGGQGGDGRAFNSEQDGWRLKESFDFIPGWSIDNSRNEKEKDQYGFSMYRVVLGKLGYRGGKGGDGGFGGRGGNKGDVKIFELRQESHGHVTVSNEPGNIGASGVGGKGGMGGKNGDDVKMEIHVQYPSTYVKVQEIGKMDTGYAEPGANGGNGACLLGRSPSKNLKIPVISFPRTVNNYKSYVLENYIDSVNNNNSQDLYTLLNERKEITNAYSFLDLIEEFIDLENQFSKLENASLLFSPYENLLKRVTDYEGKVELDETSKTFQELITDIRYRLEDKVQRNKMQGDYKAKSEMKSALDTLQTHYIQALRTAQTVSTFMDILQDSVEKLDVDINEGRNLLNMIQTSIEYVETSLDDDLDSLVSEVMDQRDIQNKQMDELSVQAKRLKETMDNKILFGIAKALFTALSLINPATAAVSAVALSTASVWENSYKNTTSIEDLSVSIPKGLNLDFKAAGELLSLKKEAMEELIKKKEEIIEEAMKTLPQKDGEVLKKWNSLNDLREEIKSPKPLKLSYRTIESKLEAQKKTLLEKAKRGAHKFTGAIKVFEKLQGLTQVAEVLGNTFKNVSADQVLFNNISTVMDQSDLNLETLREYEDSIYTDLVPVLEGIKVKLNGQKEDFDNMSSIRLEAAKWDITAHLKNVRRIIIQMTGNYTSQKDFTWTMEKLTDAMSKMINVYDRIKELEEKKEEKKFHVSLHITGQHEIPHAWFITDNRVSRANSILENIYLKNSLQLAYSEWLHAYKQYIFPNSQHLVQLPQVGDALNIFKLQAGMIQMASVLKAYAENDLPENGLYETFSHSPFSTTNPFHVWNKQQFSKEIGNLLSGNEIKLFADISEHNENDAVKFNKIDITFHSEDEKLLSELNEDLNYFAVQLTHEGDSFYRCGGSIYLMKNKPTSITHGFDPHANLTGVQYKRITGKDPMLSPYATWSIRLIRQSPVKNFSDLDKYKNKVDLELVGAASFFRNETITCNADLNKYYTSVDNVSEFRKKI